MMMLALAGGGLAQDNNSATKEGQTSPSSTVQVKETATTPVSNAAAPGDSHVRIVRLSEAQGTLAMDRGTGKGYEPTMQNMPIVEGSKLETDGGYAEVEFEDGSTLRLAPDSRVEFQQLVLHSTGVKASTVNVVRGTVYVSLENSKDNEFTLKAGQATMALAPSTHLRVESTWPKSVVSVFSGNVSVQSGGTTTSLSKKEVGTLDATDASKVEVSKKVAEATYDGWDKEQMDYHKRYANAKGNAYAGGGYGMSDLNYYGSFVNGPCGSMWQPYFASAAWDPYGNGAWAYYPGAGYSWVSPYPWGWLPYHSGAWSYCPGMGWGWQPGGTWRGLANVNPGAMGQPLTGNAAALSLAANSGAARPVGPPRPPATPMSTLVMSNRSPLVVSKESQPGNFVFQRDSAGMGVPRGSLGDLRGISNGVEHHGFVNRQVYSETMGNLPQQGVNQGHAMHNPPTTLRQGAPPQNGNLQQNGANPGGPNHSASMNNGAGSWNHGGGGGSNGSNSGAAQNHPVQTSNPSATAPGSAPEAGPRAPRSH